MRIKTSAVFGSLNCTVHFDNLIGLENFRHVRQGYLRLDGCTACIFKSGKVQIYGLKDFSLLQKTWDTFLEILSLRMDVSKADASPYLKYFTATDRLDFVPDPEKCQQYFGYAEGTKRFVLKIGEGTVILLSSGFVTLDGFNSVEKAEAAFVRLKEYLQ